MRSFAIRGHNIFGSHFPRQAIGEVSGFSGSCREKMLPDGTFESPRKQKEEISVSFSVFLNLFLGGNASFPSSARISSCLAGKMGAENVMTP